LVGRTTAPDGRTSLYRRDDVERLSRRARSRRGSSPATIDVVISSAITAIQDEGVTYRGHDAAELARTCSFEQVAELLWTGEIGEADARWPLDRERLERCRRVDDEAGAPDAFTRLAVAAVTLSADDP